MFLILELFDSVQIGILNMIKVIIADNKSGEFNKWKTE